jgi:hypothetical protein
MREQAVIDEWARMLIDWRHAFDAVRKVQDELHDKMTNHLAYNRSSPTLDELELLGNLWKQEYKEREKLNQFIVENCRSANPTKN